MNVGILNWAMGENDPFSLFSALLANSIKEHGHDALVIEYDDDLYKKLVRAKDNGADLVLTWQGLGSNSRLSSPDKSIWDVLELPLICMHGDHPCHMPSNHRHDSRFVHHLYTAQSFAIYASRYVAGAGKAKSFNIPNFFVGSGKSLHGYSGDYFVFPKNYDDTQEFFSLLERRYSEQVCDVLYEVCDRIQSETCEKNRLDHHSIIDEYLTPEFIRLVGNEIGVSDDDLSTRHHVHATLDKFYRNLIAESVLWELADIKLRIYGRGWGRFKAMGNKNHEFFDFNNVADGGWQYTSNLGLIDVAPINDALHDRTLRCLAWGNGFLLGSSWDAQQHLGDTFSELLYSAKPGELLDRAEAVQRDPDAHRQRARLFGTDYNKAFNFPSFLEKVKSISQDMFA